MKTNRNEKLGNELWGGMVIGALIVASLLTTGCWSIDTVDSADVDESTIHGSYSLTYDAQAQSLNYRVQFRVGGSTGTTVRLTPPSELLADGKAMRLHDAEDMFLNLQGSYYTYEARARSPQSAYRISWNTLSGVTHENMVSLPQPVAVVSPLSGQRHPRNQTLAVRVQISGQRGRDYLSALISTKESQLQAGERSSFTVEVEPDGYAYFPAEELSKMPAGPAVISVRRERRSYVVNGHDEAGGSVTGEIISRKVEITLD